MWWPLMPLVSFLTGDFPFSAELQCFWMAFQGSMAVRNGPNRDGKMAWFHAFMLSIISGYSGASFTALWMGRPTSMLSNDMNMMSCIIAFVVANYLPFDIGYKLGNTFPVVLITTIFAQLFRAMGVVKFCDIAFEAFRDSPSAYYPTPIFGPILLATLLGNMGGFFAKGFHGHLEKGMPWPFQNGFFCATFYHFYLHDEKGFIGRAFRKVIGGIPELLGLEDFTFAIAFVSAFMQVIPILQLPHFLGPSWSPFNYIPLLFENIRGMFQKIPGAEVKPGPGFPTSDSVVTGTATAAKKKKRRRKKKGGSGGTQPEKEKEL